MPEEKKSYLTTLTTNLVSTSVQLEERNRDKVDRNAQFTASLISLTSHMMSAGAFQALGDVVERLSDASSVFEISENVSRVIKDARASSDSFDDTNFQNYITFENHSPAKIVVVTVITLGEVKKKSTFFFKKKSKRMKVPEGSFFSTGYVDGEDVSVLAMREKIDRSTVAFCDTDVRVLLSDRDYLNLATKL